MNLNDLAHDSWPPKAPPTPEESSLDAEMREVVLKFEEIYAELAPPAEDQPASALPYDDLDVPDEFAKTLAAGKAGDTIVIPQARQRREPELALKPRLQASAAAPAVEENYRFDIDEAFSVLREAETRGKAAAERVARDAQDEDDSAEPLPRVQDVPIAQPMPATGRTPQPVVVQPQESVSSPDGATRSQTLWSIALIAASIALAVGTGVGYLMGRGHEAVPSAAKIPISPEGGAKLRADYELRKR